MLGYVILCSLNTEASEFQAGQHLFEIGNTSHFIRNLPVIEQDANRSVFSLERSMSTHTSRFSLCLDSRYKFMSVVSQFQVPLKTCLSLVSGLRRLSIASYSFPVRSPPPDILNFLRDSDDYSIWLSLCSGSTLKLSELETRMTVKRALSFSLVNELKKT